MRILLRTLGGSEKRYIDTGLSTGRTYYYKVRQAKIINGTTFSGEYSVVKSAKVVPASPARIKVKKISSTKIGVYWSKVSGASGYLIYRSYYKTKGYKKIKTITRGSTVKYTNSGLRKHKTYFYKVRAYRKAGSKKIYGPATSFAYKRL